jgi:ABC-type branched-subunit amino acid transport system ATPase component
MDLMNLLAIDRLTKSFGGVAALDNCTMILGQGSITGLIGPNGAGKTTLLNVVSGLVKADEGSVVFNGHDITGLPTHRIAALGLVRTFQIARELGGLTVLENLLLSPRRQLGESVAGALLRHTAVRQQEQQNASDARRILERIGLWRLADQSASALSGGQKKLLELARALLLEPKLILLDEPAAGVAPPLLKDIVKLILELKSEGVSFGIVEHDMHLIDEVCDQVYVLIEGKVLVSGSFADVTADQRVIDAYLGLAV